MDDNWQLRDPSEPGAERSIGMIESWLGLFLACDHGLDAGQEATVDQAQKKLTQVATELREL